MSSENETEAPRAWPTTLLFLTLLLAACVYLFYFSDLGETYAGIAVLLVIPTSIGGLISQLWDPTGEQSPMGCFLWPTMGLILLTFAAWLVFQEGAVCIAMVLPLWIPAAVAGAAVNRWNARRWRAWERGTSIYSASWLLIPLAAVALDQFDPPQWDEETVAQEIVINAPANKIWPLLVSIPHIGLDEGRWDFTHDVLGIPRPTEAILETSSGMLVRKARWGNDVRFEERIVSLHPGQSITWRFVFPDRSVERHTDRHVSPDGPTVKIVRGGYELTALAPNRTLVRLSTQYRMKTRMVPYLRWWGDRLLGDVQSNALWIINDRSTRPQAV